MIELGQEAKDKITGFKGILTARHQYLTGCDQYSICPQVNDKGEFPDIVNFDENRIEIIGRGILTPLPTPEGKTGGPQHSSRNSK